MGASAALPMTAYQPRRTELLGVEARAGWKIKVIGISASNELPSGAERAAALVAAEGVLPQPALTRTRCGTGFVIVHRGAEALWVLVCWWELDILYHQVLRAPLGTTDLQAVPAGGPTACVWELLAIDRERRTWVAAVLQHPGSPDLDGYLAETFTASPRHSADRGSMSRLAQMPQHGGAQDTPGSLPEPGPSGSGRSASSPADVIRLFSEHVNSGNVEEIMGLYEPGATYVSASGEHLRDGQIRENFQRLIMLAPQMSGEMVSVVVTGDIALLKNRWEFCAQHPDSAPARNGGISALVLRRRSDGSWGILIDDPWGAGRQS